MSALAEKIRAQFKKNDDLRDAGLTTPEEVIRYDDIIYGENERYNRLDLYRPKNNDGVLPVIISFHGGGWVYGDKERYQFYCMSLALKDFAVINFTYRLAPEFKFPAPIIDSCNVLNWLKDNAEKYKLDTNNIFAVGDSAGGQLLSTVACGLTNKEYSKESGIEFPDNIRFNAIALNCGCYDVSGEDLSNSVFAEYLSDEIDVEKQVRLSSSIHYITSDYPDVFVMDCSGDFLIKQAGIIIDVLAQNNVNFEYHFYSDRNRMLGHVFHLNMRDSLASKCNEEELDFFRKNII